MLGFDYAVPSAVLNAIVEMKVDDFGGSFLLFASFINFMVLILLQLLSEQPFVSEKTKTNKKKSKEIKQKQKQNKNKRQKHYQKTSEYAQCYDDTMTIFCRFIQVQLYLSLLLFYKH